MGQKYIDDSKVTKMKAAPQQVHSSGILPNCNNSDFPVKLHYMLGELACDGLEHIASWQPHGRSFLVRKPKDFVKEILPLWFRQFKIESFQRQLNIYGFRRITVGKFGVVKSPDSYYHEHFLRGKPLLTHHITRNKVKVCGPRKPSSPETEPNFYTMPFLPISEDNAPTKAKEQHQALPLLAMSVNGGNFGFANAVTTSMPVPMDSSVALQAFPRGRNMVAGPPTLAFLALSLAAHNVGLPLVPQVEAVALQMQLALPPAAVSLSQDGSLAQAMLLQPFVRRENDFETFVRNYYQRQNKEDSPAAVYRVCNTVTYR